MSQTTTPSIVSKYIAIWKETQVHPQRACDLCAHGEGVPGHRFCEHPDVRSLPVAVNRAGGGMCGPEANNFTLATA